MKKQVLRSYLFLFIFLSFTSYRLSAALVQGDIAIIGLNCDPAASLSKTFAIVALADLGPSEVIYFSDKAYYAGAFGPLLGNGSEGRFSWTTPGGGVNKGTVIMFTVTSGAAPTVTTTPSTGSCTVIEGWTSISSTVSPFGQNGDNILIYQGAEVSPTFIFGFNSGNNTLGVTNGWQSGLATNPNGACEKPASLTSGTTAIGLGGTAHFDNYVYNGITTGSKAALLAAIGNTLNWIHAIDDITAWDFTPGGAVFAGSQPIFTLSVLPVHLVSFTGTAINDKHQLNWTVENETNFSYYSIEQGDDGTAFSKVAQVPASGKRQYDITVPAPAKEVSYYRLKMVDMNNTFAYSNILVVRKKDVHNTSVVISPNPIQDWINIRSNGSIEKITITDVQGKALLSLSGNNGQTLSFSMNAFTKGIYWIRIKTGDETIVKKIMKQ